MENLLFLGVQILKRIRVYTGAMDGLMDDDDDGIEFYAPSVIFRRRRNYNEKLCAMAPGYGMTQSIRRRVPAGFLCPYYQRQTLRLQNVLKLFETES